MDKPRIEPPFDGSPACPACPAVVRNLSATAHNAVGAYQAACNGSGDWHRAHRKMAELVEAVKDFKPVIEGHFADPMHSHGRLR